MDIIIGGVYEHFKGMRYCVVGVAKDSETLEEMIVYRQLYGDFELWVRPKKMFLETITRHGKEMPRFHLIQE